jgi:hypothetical protein
LRQPVISNEHVASIFRVKNKPRKKPIASSKLVLIVAYSSTLKLETAFASETSGYLGTARHYNPVDRRGELGITDYINFDYKLSVVFCRSVKSTADDAHLL